MHITDELIDEAVRGCSAATEMILEYYDTYVTSLAFVDFYDKSGMHIQYYEPEIKNRIHQKMRAVIPRFVYRPIGEANQ